MVYVVGNYWFKYCDNHSVKVYYVCNKTFFQISKYMLWLFVLASNSQWCFSNYLVLIRMLKKNATVNLQHITRHIFLFRPVSCSKEIIFSDLWDFMELLSSLEHRLINNYLTRLHYCTYILKPLLYCILIALTSFSVIILNIEKYLKQKTCYFNKIKV